MTSAVNSALNGLAASRAWMDTAAQTTARAATGSGTQDDLVDGVVGAVLAGEATAVSVALLRRTLDSEHALLDIFA